MGESGKHDSFFGQDSFDDKDDRREFFLTTANIKKKSRWCYGPFKKKEAKNFLRHVRGKLDFGGSAVHECVDNKKNRIPDGHYVTISEPKKSTVKDISEMFEIALRYASKQMDLEFGRENVKDWRRHVF